LLFEQIVFSTQRNHPQFESKIYHICHHVPTNIFKHIKLLHVSKFTGPSSLITLIVLRNNKLLDTITTNVLPIDEPVKSET